MTLNQASKSTVQYQDLPLELRSRILDLARHNTLKPGADPLHLAFRQVRHEPMALKQYKLGISNWYNTHNLFDADFHALNSKYNNNFSAKFDIPMDGYLYRNAQVPDENNFFINALEKLGPITHCLVLRPMPGPHEVIIKLEFDNKPHPSGDVDLRPRKTAASTPTVLC